MSAARLAHLLIALLALAGLALHYAIVLGHAGEVAIRSVRFLSYFTILSNALVAVAAIGRLLPDGHRCQRLVLPAQRGAVTLYIVVVALIFHLLLRQTLPGAIGWWANLLVHTIVPLGWVACWLAFGPHGGIDRMAPLRWLIFPLAFGAWTLIHGAIGGWYPYPFMDVAAAGYPVVLRNLGLIAALFLALGYAVRWVDGVLKARRP